jgi:hypothetical protein
MANFMTEKKIVIFFGLILILAIALDAQVSKKTVTGYVCLLSWGRRLSTKYRFRW